MRRHGWIGLGLIAVAWPLNGSLTGLRTHLLFFPLWLGYVLLVDGLVCLRTGTSTWTRSRSGFARLFLASMPAWWIFELANLRLSNWEYLGREHFSDLAYFLLCSLSFSTVMPAVFVTSELVRSFRFVERFAGGPRLAPSRRGLATIFATGLVMTASMIVWPRFGYPLLWVSGVFLLEPLCRWSGRRSLTSDLARGDWRPWISLWGGALSCGFFWELWNVFSYPKWTYHVPGVDFLHVFEMPLLGYLGYLPFSLELYLLAQLLVPGSGEPSLAPRPARPGGLTPPGGGGSEDPVRGCPGHGTRASPGGASTSPAPRPPGSGNEPLACLCPEPGPQVGRRTPTP